VLVLVGNKKGIEMKITHRVPIREPQRKKPIYGDILVDGRMILKWILEK
jgi:hypothetical protein